MKATKYIALASISLLAATTIGSTAVSAADGGAYKSTGSIEFVPSQDTTDPVDPENPDPTDPVDPENPDGTDPEPGTQGPLSIDYASSLDFGTNKISSKDETYFARAQKYALDATGAPTHADTPNYVQVSDLRGSNAGWTLTVTQAADFESTTATDHNTLTGAEVTLASPVTASNAAGITAPDVIDNITLTPGSASLVMSAKDKAGAGTWVDRWGTVETVKEKQADGTEVDVNVTKAVSLAVPGATPKDAVQYTATLNWNLSDVPGA